MSILCYFIDSQGKQTENLQTNQVKYFSIPANSGFSARLPHPLIPLFYSPLAIGKKEFFNVFVAHF